MLRKTLCGLAAAACIMAAPAVAEPNLKVPVTEFTLNNGLHVILHEDHTVPIVHTNIWYRVGSANEEKGKTGFAHLFEHLMFEGSGHVQEGEFDTLLESAGGNNNASTSKDRTNYYISIPSGSLDLPLFLESDRMGFLLDSMSKDIVNEQRDVVKNEMRQSYLNRPYGVLWLELPQIMYPEGHPYHHPVIGSMEDLDAAGYDDVAGFFRKFYVPGNACLVVAGDINPKEAKEKIEKWFSDVKPGDPVPVVKAEPVAFEGIVKKEVTDKVELPLRLCAWHTPAVLEKGDADLDVISFILAGSKNSRLYKRLVYEEQIAQSVSASQMSSRLSSIFAIDFIPRPGHTIDEIQKAVDEEVARLAKEPPAAKEIELALNTLKTETYRNLEKCAAKADQLNAYYTYTGTPDYFQADLDRYSSVTPESIMETVRTWLPLDRRAELTVLPEKEAEK